MAAPAGNNFSAKDRLFRQAILNIIDEHPEGRMAGAIALIRPIMAKAMDGDLAAAQEILNRVDGKSTQQVDVQNDTSITITVNRPQLSQSDWLATHGLNVVDNQQVIEHKSADMLPQSIVNVDDKANTDSR